MVELNRRRNGYSHGPALSEEAAERISAESEDEVVGVLKQLEWLREVTLTRYVGAGSAASIVRVETFSGFALTRRIKNVEFLPEQMATVAAQTGLDRISAMIGDEVRCLRPFVHFKSFADGNLSKLAMYRQRVTRDGERFLQFGLPDEADLVEVSASAFPELAGFEATCQTLPAAGGTTRAE